MGIDAKTCTRAGATNSTYNDPPDDHSRMIANLNAAWSRLADELGRLRAMPTRDVAQDVSDAAAEKVRVNLLLVDWLRIEHDVTPTLMESERAEIREALQRSVKP